MPFATYLALGDSISIDHYPVIDYAERHGGRLLRTRGLGAAALLFRNDDEVWPEFRGRDLSHLHPGVAFRDATADGATTEDVLGAQLRALRELPGPSETLVTLTAGGNDLLGLVGASDRAGEEGVRAVLGRLDAILAELRAHLPRAALLVANVYDPTDGTGDLGGARLRRQELEWLAAFNAGVARLCRDRAARLADIHGHFLGHGVTAPAAAQWYWTRSLIEPGYRGASEVRRLWLDALDAAQPSARDSRSDRTP